MATPFYKVQAGQEGTAGTAVAATVVLAGLKFRPGMGYLNIIQPDEERGSLARYARNYVASKLVEGTLEGEATFEEIVIPLCMTIEDIDGSAPATNLSTYDWDFEPNWTSSNSPGTWTLEFGDDVQAWEAEYVFGTGLTISGSQEEAWQVSCPVVGRKMATTSFTGSKSVASDLTTILFQESKLYFDAEDGTIGSTQVTGSFLDFEWSMGDHYAPRFTGDGELYFNAVRECKVAPTLNLTLVLDATTKTYITSLYENQTQRLVRVAADGKTTGDGGYARYCYIDGCYVITDLAELADRDCDTVMSLTLTGEYGSNYGKVFNVKVRNELQYPPGEAS